MIASGVMSDCTPEHPANVSIAGGLYEWQVSDRAAISMCRCVERYSLSDERPNILLPLGHHVSPQRR